MSIQITGGAAGLATTGGTLTGPLAIAVGSAAAPGLAVAGDANTGLWAPAADTLAVATAGVEIIRVGANGNVGIAGTFEVITTQGDFLKLTNVGDFEAFHVNLSAQNGYPRAYMQLNGEDGFLVCPDQAQSVQFTVGASGINMLSASGGQFFFSSNEGLYTNRGLYVEGSNVGVRLTPVTSAALLLPAGTTAIAPLRITTGVAPAAPVDGDMWVAGGAIYIRLGGITKGFVLA